MGFVAGSAALSAIFPGRIGDREGLDIGEKHGLDDFQYDEGVVAVFFPDVDNPAFDVSRKILQDGCGSRAFEKGLAIEVGGTSTSGREELLGNLLLMLAHNVKHGDATFGETAKDAAFGADGGHEERRAKRGLRNPGDGGGAEAILPSGGKNVDAVRQKAKRLLFGLWVHAQRTSGPAAHSTSDTARDKSDLRNREERMSVLLGIQRERAAQFV